MVGGMVMIAAAGTAAAIKLSKQDAQRIEEHTGLPPEQLEDEDLNQAMRELNIQPQSLTPEEQAAFDQQAGAQGSIPAAPPPVEAPAAAAPSYMDELVQLAQLRDQGIISAEDFEAKKKQLLGI